MNMGGNILTFDSGRILINQTGIEKVELNNTLSSGKQFINFNNDLGNTGAIYQGGSAASSGGHPLYTGGVFAIQGGAGSPKMIIGHDQANPIYFTMGVSSDLNTRMKITNAGTIIGHNVGGDTAVARLQVKGSGTTSGTTALLVQNSAGTDLLEVQDDGTILGNLPNMYGADGSISATRTVTMGTGKDLYFKGTNPRVYIEATGGGTQSGDLRFINDAGLAASLIIGGTVYGGAPNLYNKISLISDTDGINFKNSTANKPINFLFGGWADSNRRAILTQDGLLLKGSSATVTPSAKLHVIGNGTTSGTTALLVENSAGTDLLEVKDDGAVHVGVLPPTSSGSGEALVRNPSTGQVEIQAELPLYISDITTVNLIDDVANWDLNGNYTGTAITGTFQGQHHVNSTYWFTCTHDNIWIRMARI